mmetsp:Transcript_25281/g.78045  ORF Transcript_25281/g.78045 Transcript_25281/m.78045 type:complete len:231 (-) Transcript_25281:202-894(-)
MRRDTHAALSSSSSRRSASSSSSMGSAGLAVSGSLLVGTLGPMSMGAGSAVAVALGFSAAFFAAFSAFLSSAIISLSSSMRSSSSTTSVPIGWPSISAMRACSSIASRMRSMSSSTLSASMPLLMRSSSLVASRCARRTSAFIALSSMVILIVSMFARWLASFCKLSSYSFLRFMHSIARFRFFFAIASFARCVSRSIFFCNWRSRASIASIVSSIRLTTRLVPPPPLPP